MKSGLLLLMVLIVTSACSPMRFRQYIDPTHELMRYEDLSRPPAPLLLKLSVSVSVGDPVIQLDPASEPAIRNTVARVLRKSGLVWSSYSGKDGTLAVAVEKTRLSYEDDGPGSHARSDYLVTARINTDGKPAVARAEHATIWYLGDAKEPESLTMPVDEHVDALLVMIEQAVLRILRDFQEAGIIPGSSQLTGACGLPSATAAGKRAKWLPVGISISGQKNSSIPS